MMLRWPISIFSVPFNPQLPAVLHASLVRRCDAARAVSQRMRKGALWSGSAARRGIRRKLVSAGVPEELVGETMTHLTSR